MPTTVFLEYTAYISVKIPNSVAGKIRSGEISAGNKWGSIFTYTNNDMVETEYKGEICDVDYKRANGDSSSWDFCDVEESDDESDDFCCGVCRGKMTDTTCCEGECGLLTCADCLKDDMKCIICSQEKAEIVPVFSSEVASLLESLMTKNGGVLPDGVIQKCVEGKVWVSKDDSWSEIPDPGQPEDEKKCSSCNGRDCEEDCLSETEFEPIPVPQKLIYGTNASPIPKDFPESTRQWAKIEAHYKFMTEEPHILSKTCGKCGGDAGRYGNNPSPLPYETVCDQCNLLYGIPTRMKLYALDKLAKGINTTECSLSS